MCDGELRGEEQGGVRPPTLMMSLRGSLLAMLTSVQYLQSSGKTFRSQCARVQSRAPGGGGH